MKNKYFPWIVSGILLLITAILTYLLLNGNLSTNNSNIVSDLTTVDNSDFLKQDDYFNALPTENLSQAEKDSLIQMREEEKLAHDVYTTLYETWGEKIFQNISDSEQTHTDMVKALLVKYGINDPAENKAIGEFTSSDIQKLYTELVNQGKTSVISALKIGALVEDLDIDDLNKLSKTVDNQDILTVYNNLEKGSRNHLRSFTKVISRNGDTYTPKYISVEEYESIINSASENGTVLDSKGNKR